jgi:SAM-dependent methyltransferase
LHTQMVLGWGKSYFYAWDGLVCERKVTQHPMGKFQVTLIRPQGYLHTDAFREIAEALQSGLRSLGHSANIAENVIDRSARNLLLGAHLLPPQDARFVPAGSIIYNLEQLGGAQLQPAYYDVARQHQIWDYDLRNLEKWKGLRCIHPPVHVPVGYVPELTRILPAPTQDIDVLFYGSLNQRRNRILNALKDHGVKVHAVFGVYGRERDALIARSKIVLNIHFYEAKVFEIVRISYLLANSKAVVTECSPDTIEAGLSDCVRAVPYEAIVENCCSLLNKDAERRGLESRGFHWFSQRKESDILNNALQGTATASAPKAAFASIPRKLNLGSGKDWREDYFNVDIDPYWQPDAVMDFNQPAPIGQLLASSRFGTVTLENNYFDEIIANDALEHIRNLTTAMSTCLNLLRVGGLFRIAVPYDLSWGAWQDPTHVRAFNERSWLYYTDWFWYMGWTEARFDIAAFDLGLSPVGEALKRQQMKGEDLVRFPRAVDQMRVTLRKRTLTEAEKQQVGLYLRRPNRFMNHVAASNPAQAPVATGLPGMAPAL